MTRFAIKRFAVSAALVAATVAPPAGALGAAGDPDPSFDGDGMVMTAFGTTPFHPFDSGNAAARLASGEVYVAGASGGDFALVRFTAAGALDTTFGGGDGIAITDISGAGSPDQAAAVSVDTGTGNVVVAGQTGSNETADFALVRYTSTGALDPGFGGDGIVTTDFPTGVEDAASAVTAVAGGGVIAAGLTDSDPDGDINAFDFALAAYTSGGALDPSFDGDPGNAGGGDGLVATDFGSDDDLASAALLTTAGSKLVVAGATDPATVDGGDFAVARYSASTGVLDTSFDGDGRTTISFVEVAGNGDAAYGLATDSSGRILVAGQAGPGNGDFALARLDGTSGALDTSFSIDGKQVHSTPASPPTINSQDAGYSVLVQADGKIVLAGHEGSQNGRFLLMRLDGTTGGLDPAFDSDGILITDFGGNVFAGAAAVFADEGASKLIAAGTGNSNFAAARYAMGNGSLDGAYGVGGKVEADVPHPVQSSEFARSIAIRPDGKIVVAGPTNVDAITQVGGDMQFGLARYNADGSFDTGFGAGGVDGDGRVSTNFDTFANGAGTVDTANGVALQSDGKTVVAGTTDPVGADPGDFAVARYTSGGTLDPSFGGGDGLVTTDFAGALGDGATAVAVQGTAGSPDFRIVVAGSKDLTNLDSDFALAALEVDGSPDLAFGGTGKITADFGAREEARAVAVQPDASIVAAGSYIDFSNNNFAVARFEPDGDPDPTFDADGRLLTDFVPGGFGGNDAANSVLVRDLGAGEVRIVVAGQADGGDDGNSDGGIAVYATDGSLDPAFAPGGADGNGKASFNLASSNVFDALYGVALAPGGKIVASGSMEAPMFGVLRADSAGSLDPGFGGDGLASTSFGLSPGSQYRAAAVGAQADGRVVAAGGGFFAANGSDFLVARYAAAPSSSNPPVKPPAGKRKKCKKGRKLKKVKGKKKCVKKKRKKRR